MSTEHASGEEVLAAFAQVVKWHSGKLVAPESALPFPRKQIREAILAVALQARRDMESESLKSTLLSLEAFVRDEDAAAVDAYLADSSRGGSSVVSKEEKERAERVLERIGLAQGGVIAWMRNEDWPGAAERFSPKDPIPIGSTQASRKALDEAEASRSAQLFGFMAMPAALLFLVLLIGAAFDNPKLLLQWRFWLFGVLAWLAGARGKIPAMLIRFLPDEQQYPQRFERSMWLLVAVAVGLPFVVLGALFYLLVLRALP